MKVLDRRQVSAFAALSESAARSPLAMPFHFRLTILENPNEKSVVLLIIARLRDSSLRRARNVKITLRSAEFNSTLG